MQGAGDNHSSLYTTKTVQSPSSDQHAEAFDRLDRSQSTIPTERELDASFDPLFDTDIARMQKKKMFKAFQHVSQALTCQRQTATHHQMYQTQLFK